MVGTQAADYVDELARFSAQQSLKPLTTLYSSLIGGNSETSSQLTPCTASYEKPQQGLFSYLAERELDSGTLGSIGGRRSWPTNAELTE